jgi:hypothetical protein
VKKANDYRLDLGIFDFLDGPPNTFGIKRLDHLTPPIHPLLNL